MWLLLKHLFKKDGGNISRKLMHPRDLQVGDIIRFGYLPQSDISNKQFEITGIGIYKYGGLTYPEWILKDSSSHILYLMVEEEDGEEYLGISKKIPATRVDELFDSNELALVMEKGRGTKVTVRSCPEDLKEWLKSTYKETEDQVKGSFIRSAATEESQQEEVFISHILTDSSDEFAIEIEIYASNEIEICATVYHECSAIKEMWPSK